MSRTAIYRGQRFNVVDENARFVTLEGFGYKKKVQLEEVIFEEEPIDELKPEREPETLLKEPAVEDMPSEHKDNDLLNLKEIEAMSQPQKKSIRVSYEIWDDAAVEAGDTDERGWENEEGFDMTPHDQEETAVSNAVDFLKKHGPVEASSTQFHPGIWYSAEAQPDFKTGKAKVLSFHLVGFDEAEEKEIYESLRKGKLKETLAKFVVQPTPEAASTPAPEVSEKKTPDYPKFGLDLSVDTAADRHKENEDRRKAYMSDFKMKLKEMMDKLDEMDASPEPVSTDPACETCDTEIKQLEEDGAATASAGGGVPDAAGAVNVPLKGSGGVSTANVANFNARMNIGLNRKEREKETFKNVTE